MRETSGFGMLMLMLMLMLARAELAAGLAGRSGTAENRSLRLS